MCLSLTTLMMISTGLQVVSALSAGQQKSDAAEWQARQAAADSQAEREMGEVRADKIRKAGRRQKSEARAALAAGGVEIGAGTPIKIAEQITRDSEADAQQELLSGKYSAARLESESEGYKVAAENARTSSYLKAGGSLLAGGEAWYRNDLNTAASQYGWD